jgi:multidrug resistance efflux pump
MTHRCSICGALWSGVHQCSPVQHVSFRQITGDMISDGEEAVREGRFTTLSQIKTEMQLREEVDQLRAALAAAEAKLAALIETAERCRDMLKFKRADRLRPFQQGSANGRAWAELNAAIARARSSSPHSA